MWIVALGLLDTGYEFIGPFQSEQDGRAWIEHNLADKGLYNDILVLRSPEHAAEIINRVNPGE